MFGRGPEINWQFSSENNPNSKTGEIAMKDSKSVNFNNPLITAEHLKQLRILAAYNEPLLCVANRIIDPSDRLRRDH
jgi:hypothetical protein